jgi:hypothetical protein
MELLMRVSRAPDGDLMLKLLCLAAAALVGFTATECALARPAAVHAECAKLPGASEALASGKRFILFGEMHGTAETPALFADFVCAAAQAGPVVVGLEIDHAEQTAIDSFLASDGRAAALARLRATDHFTYGRDGRASLAMLAMIERLGALKAAGLLIRVEAFAPPMALSGSQTPYEKAMAERWRSSLAAAPGARFIGLVGNVHAMRSAVFGFEPAAMHMPREDLLTLNYAPVGGSAWACREDGCKPHDVGPTGFIAPRGIFKSPAGDSYDLSYSPGRSFTPSPPANQRAADAAAPPTPVGR